MHYTTKWNETVVSSKLTVYSCILSLIVIHVSFKGNGMWNFFVILNVTKCNTYWDCGEGWFKKIKRNSVIVTEWTVRASKEQSEIKDTTVTYWLVIDDYLYNVWSFLVPPVF